MSMFIKRWLRRLLYLILFIIWLLFMAFPFVAFRLATNGQVQVGDESHLRLFLVQETDANGLGVEWRRQLFQPDNCLRTSVGFLMWEGDSEGVTYCQCYDLVTDAPLGGAAAACVMP